MTGSMADDLQWVDATGQAELVQTGACSPAELVDAAIDRIEALDPAINAVVLRRFDAARREAARSKAGPLGGVPVVLKDAHATSAGDPHHEGSRVLRDAGFVATQDSRTVELLRGAGCIILGRTNVPELCTWPSTEPVAYGPTRNPWDLSRSAGGSSGGSAAAVAAGMVPMGHGSDGGGSVRVPASMCGIVGVKPTRGRISAAPVGQFWSGLSTEGVLCRTVRDAAAFLDVLSTHQPGDPYTAPPRMEPYVSVVAGASDRVLGGDVGTPLSIGVLDQLPASITADRECLTAVAKTGQALAELGHHVETSWPEALADVEQMAHSRVLVVANVAAEVATWETWLGRAIDDSELEDINAGYRAWGKRVSALDLLAAEEGLNRYSRRLAQWWASGFDVLVLPSLSVTPPPLGWFNDLATTDGKWSGMFNFTGPFNVTGQPAVSLPLHWSDDGLPVGVQLVAAYGREDVLLAVAATLERVMPWDMRRPVPVGGSTEPAPTVTG